MRGFNLGHMMYTAVGYASRTFIEPGRYPKMVRDAYPTKLTRVAMINNIPKLKVFLIRNKVKLIIVLFSFAFLPLYVYGITEPAIRGCSLVFQLLGIGTVIWGINETKKSFGHPPIIDINKYINKAKTLLGIRRNREQHICYLDCSYDLRCYGPHETYEPLAYEPGANHTIDTLAEALKENVNSIHERISQTQKGIDKDFHETNGNLKREEQSRQTEDISILKKLEMTSTGGFDISLFGAVFLILGAFFGTASHEIFDLYSKSKVDTTFRPASILIPGINIHCNYSA